MACSPASAGLSFYAQPPLAGDVTDARDLMDCLRSLSVPRMMTQLILKRASASRPSGAWDDDDFDVLADGVVVGRIFNSNAGPVGSPWMWTLAFGHHEDRTPTHGYAETREARWRRSRRAWRRE